MKTEEQAVINYSVERSERSTTDIIVERDGTILVRAPSWIDDQRVSKIVRSKQHWIYKSLAEWRDLNATRVIREFKNGEGFLYLGRSYRLSLVSERQQKVDLQLKNGRFQLRRELVDNGDLAAVRSAFRKFYSERGSERIQERVDYFAPKVGVPIPTIDIRDLGFKWASCKPGRASEVSFDWRCMMAPQTVIDYIVAHELCHFHYLDHTEAFWNEVDKVIPKWRERKEWLRKNGAGLDI
ncbi:SprT family zinc-dependent metalloprotease [Pelagicoccus enzymogenes]|uniref:M48 family metallopeptidase n=1 Tax=Pelagicoccus enzymogenes TaxID=2773457 RepID=UPI00280D8EE4|nr:SprT family zinc-dependent metalloprotease [Pelagicoccus enzymogenes]MDQ8199382.1 SprT family zinc-dependent metalloprotease [Pelagicoccus enzymogenes]